MALPFITIQTDLPPLDLSSYQLSSKSPSPRCKSQSAYIPASNYIAGMIWYYIEQVNRTNFKYDITSFDEDKLWYHVYNQNSYYKWHQDAGIQTSYNNTETASSIHPSVQDTIIPLAEHNRKLSFSLQLSSPEDYTGGDLQFLTEPALNVAPQLYTASKRQGSIIIFDPYIVHRVTPVQSGQRKSLVGWAIGPRWK